MANTGKCYYQLGRVIWMFKYKRSVKCDKTKKCNIKMSNSISRFIFFFWILKINQPSIYFRSLFKLNVLRCFLSFKVMQFIHSWNIFDNTQVLVSAIVEIVVYKVFFKIVFEYFSDYLWQLLERKKTSFQIFTLKL